MAGEIWPVQKPDGSEWGRVTKLIIHPQTRQISHADVLVNGTARLIRIAWANFLVTDDALVLRVDNPPIVAVLSVGQPALPEPRLEVMAENHVTIVH
jgi:hypothetical protein